VADARTLVNPPFRADQVGSLLRPASVLEARRRHRAGEIGPAELRSVEDAAIAEAVAKFFADLAQCYRDELAALYAAGCRYVQLDDTNLAYLCDVKMRAAARDRGDDPDELPRTYAELINAVIDGRPSDLTVGVHLCRGNYRSTWFAEGGYEPVAEVLFNELHVDAYFLEYDDERSGDFAPLRFVPEGKVVVLGLVSSKRAELESPSDLAARVGEAAAYVPLERLCLSPQCGFSSTVQGNQITQDDQWAKLQLVVDTAREIWGD
jgi:5-methyltetrahydropteroyltriglutamate--homocysteine methyltransferase